jgi:hypothetical protein
VAVDERADEAAIRKSGKATRVIRLWRVMADAFFPIPIAFNLHPVFVEPAAPETMGELISIAILNGFIRHHGAPLICLGLNLTGIGIHDKKIY